MFFFQLPALPERALARGGFSQAKRFLRDGSAPGSFSDEDLERYVAAWSQAGALTAMINYYRAVFRQSPRAHAARMRTIEAPTMVIWGQRDPHIGAELAEPSRSLVPNVRMERVREAGHFVQHDASERVNELLTDFLRGPRAAPLSAQDIYGESWIDQT
jgi:epoxide hydrolase 4